MTHMLMLAAPQLHKSAAVEELLPYEGSTGP